ADSSSVTIYDQTHEIVCYARCWERGQTFGAERFQKELYAQMAAAQRSAAQQRLVRLLGPVAEPYLRELAGTDRSLARQVPAPFAPWPAGGGNGPIVFAIPSRKQYLPR